MIRHEVRTLRSFQSKKGFLSMLDHYKEPGTATEKPTMVDQLVENIVSDTRYRMVAAGFLSSMGKNLTFKERQGIVLFVGFVGKADDLLDKGDVIPADIPEFRKDMLNRSAFTLGDDTAISMGQVLEQIESIFPDKKDAINTFLNGELAVHINNPSRREVGSYGIADVELYRSLTNDPYTEMVASLCNIDLEHRVRRGQIVDGKQKALAGGRMTQLIDDLFDMIPDAHNDQLNYLLGLASDHGKLQDLRDGFMDVDAYKALSQTGKNRVVRMLMQKVPQVSKDYREKLLQTMDETSLHGVLKFGLSRVVHYLLP